jgi:hypothetical protein
MTIPKMENHCEAWKRVCKAFKEVKSDSDMEKVSAVIEECMTLYGDPNAPVPQGIIRTDPKKIQEAAEKGFRS